MTQYEMDIARAMRGMSKALQGKDGKWYPDRFAYWQRESNRLLKLKDYFTKEIEEGSKQDSMISKIKP